MHKLLFTILAMLVSLAAHAEDRLISVPTRDNQTIAYWWMPTANATATVLLFSGGNGGIGMSGGQPKSGNFLIRSRDHFRAQGFNVALIGNPSDKRQMDDLWRTSPAHITDLQNIMASIGQEAAAPMWLIGTSRGTISAAAAAIHLNQQIAGVVFTAAITSQKLPASVPRQNIEAIKVPALIYHHKDDACAVTVPDETEWIFRGLKNAPIKRRTIVTGGENPTGDPCEAFHWHGFIGMEAAAVKDIAEWIRRPQP